ncbi:MAG: hypothetical protein HY695_27960 [Deltaproteobacteria bacterium]|nr:hypothetical protein [Deltaproteobacteria bacterium]
MGARSRFEFRREGSWNLLVSPESWSQDLWEEVLSQIKRIAPSGHPQTTRFRLDQVVSAEEYYLKVYHDLDLWTGLKDALRDSKALRALKQGEALRCRGFDVPLAVAAGEKRQFGWLQKAFLLTRAVKALPLPDFLREQACMPARVIGMRIKRERVKKLALEVRRLHQDGFVHGDLIPSNIMVQTDAGRFIFYIIDHDRTRRYPRWVPHQLWKRNLVQLNRMVLPGISLQDRMWFLKCYLGKKSWEKRDRRLIRWLEWKTRKRRQECERIQAQVSFRELMRWNGPFSGSAPQKDNRLIQWH